jgi:Holliday junction resolvase RusA-like endonuclease
MVPRPKTTKRLSPRGDVDNYFKTLDSLNGTVWKDDDQIVWAIMVKDYGDPAIHLEIKEIDGIPKTRALPEM